MKKNIVFIFILGIIMIHAIMVTAVEEEVTPQQQEKSWFQRRKESFFGKNDLEKENQAKAEKDNQIKAEKEKQAKYANTINEASRYLLDRTDLDIQAIDSIKNLSSDEKIKILDGAITLSGTSISQS